MSLASCKDRTHVVRELRIVYRDDDEHASRKAPAAFENRQWGQRIPRSPGADDETGSISSRILRSHAPDHIRTVEALNSNLRMAL